MHKKSGIVKYILPSAHGLLDHILKTVFAKDRYRGYGAKSAENRISVFSCLRQDVLKGKSRLLAKADHLIKMIRKTFCL